MKLLLFSALFLSLPAFSNELSGSIWALSGAGCRDASLSSSSHISQPPLSADVTAGVIYFEDESRINMTITIQGKEEIRRGAYYIRGDKVIVDNGRMEMNISEERLIVVGSRTESAELCCGLRFLENWREYKEELSRTEDHPEGGWEEQKANKGWNEEWLAGNSEEYDRLKDKCRRENPFVYVLGKVN